MKPSFDILIVGIGGQGTVLASNVLGEACIIENRTVRSAETHGMAQRGGSVESHVRIDGRFGSLIVPGTADLLIAFDLLEALRYRHYLPAGGRLVVNRHLVVPTSVYQQELAVPDEESILAALSDLEVTCIDAARLAEEAGSILSQNIVMLGAASGDIPLQPGSLEEAVRRCVPKKTVEVNARAFRLGREEGMLGRGAA
ncbi:MULTISPECIES: indolepyruvate oxidoreductase subunit beta [unclassified Methanoculleus]|jgi:indolepyruvate ferredoxin oxidoreductase beta subunit|uniref:Indolepyruvate oxidoreductase subunit beta n=1 Tax=Methanoculleus palmolei TaxID=72612 RepID=A0ABD8AAE7_9EURY|nr:indolepyruvate oxidoreductase subunit beta [Methanoculleus sp. UBA377]MDD2472740.1 indolepyruvate oxidoreductase subunit beta [Methanoculleus sp.]WOX55571.1 indolepyruvate oxidoreductase subunit beta [Methanoculleus palmolei]